MSSKTTKRCLLCGRVLPSCGEQFDLRLRFSDLRLRLTWCIDCAGKDEIHLDIATGLCSDNDEMARDAVGRLLDDLPRRHSGRILQAVAESVGVKLEAR